MNEESRIVIDYRRQRAWETLKDARILADAGRLNACLNRLYYACFYMVSALLLTQGLSASKHSGVLGLFNQRFIKPGTLSREHGKLFKELYEKRQEGDYLDFASFEHDDVIRLFPKVEAFLEALEALLARMQ